MSSFPWHVVYYEDEKERSPAFEEIARLSDQHRAKVKRWIALLEEKGPLVPRPYADLLTDGIHELRVKLGGNHFRVLYFFCFKDIIVLTHTFVKHTSAVDPMEIKKAKIYRDDFFRRFKEGDVRKEIQS